MGLPIVALKDLCADFKKDIVDGPFGSNLKRSHFTEEGIPVLKIQNIKPFKIEKKKMDFVTLDKFSELERHSFRQGDIVMTKLGSPLGVSAIVDDIKEGVIVADLVRIRASKIDTRYLCYHLNSPVTQKHINSFQKGATRPRVKISVARELPIYTPSESEQKRIVQILDKAFADIDQARVNTEQNLQNARELFDSYLQQVFSERGDGYEEKTLKEISLDFGRGKSKHRPRNDESLYGGQYPFIQTGDVRNSEHVIKSYSKTYNDKGLSQSKLWPKRTICITIAANIAETGILDFDACFPDSVIGIVVDPKLTSISYVEFLLQSFKAILKAKGKGSAQDNINLGTFEKMHFPFPSIEKQNEIVTSLNQLLEATIKLEAVYAKKINSLDELKQSLLQQAFTGQLTQG
ncbi:restriction endonuclease subunit S [Vibrio parahaemolyticus]|nr:restriction endonuclease subunit S [Vibrio parahaemolyticus]EJG1105898.1 restriction endonuclease subunit S [Vibrio parahaemolyticus]ELA6668338.1 restriction endonuclease subunit S [Vibrio parahaemolyticus]